MHRMLAGVVACIVVAAACSPASSPAPSAAPSPSAAVATVTPATLPPPSATGPLAFPADEGGPLAPGIYAATFAGLTLELQIADAGWSGFVIPDDGIGFGPTGVQSAVSITHFDGTVFSEPCSGDKTKTIEPSAQAFVANLATNKELKVGSPVAVKLAGIDAIQVDVTADVPPPCPDAPRIWLWVLPVTGDFHLDEDESARFVVADVGDKTVVVVEESFAGADQSALLAGAEPILRTLVIH